MSFGQGGPQFGPGGTPESSTPDWSALAADAEEARGRRRRWMIIGGGAVAAAAVAGIVALAVVSQNGGDTGAAGTPDKLPTPADLSPSSGGEPTFEEEPPPPAPPEDFISDAAHDKAPLSAATLFPNRTVTIHGRPYTRHATDASRDCAEAAHGALGPVLTRNHCRSLYRATYTNGGLAVTIGIAVFDDADTAGAARQGYKPNLVALPGSGVPDFCRTVTCRTTVADYGRYAYFTIAGRTNGKPSTDADTAAKQAGRDGSDYAYASILKRGQDQAEAAASASARSR